MNSVPTRWRSWRRNGKGSGGGAIPAGPGPRKEFFVIEARIPPTAAEERTTAQVLRGIYVEAVAARAAELGDPLSVVELLGFEAKAKALFPGEAEAV